LVLVEPVSTMFPRLERITLVVGKCRKAWLVLALSIPNFKLCSLLFLVSFVQVTTCPYPAKLTPLATEQTYKPNLGPTSPWTAFNEVFGWGLDGADPFESDLSSYGTGFGTDALSAAWLLCSSGGGGGVSQSMGFEPLQHQFSGATGAVGQDGGVRSAGMGVGNAVGDGKEKADNPWVGAVIGHTPGPPAN
jgi:hypothetical protein